MNLSEAEVRQIVREELRSLLLSGLGRSQSEGGLLPAKNAFSKLGMDSEKSLYDAVSSGLLRLNKEVFDRRKPGSKKPRYAFDVDACLERLKENPETRRAV